MTTTIAVTGLETAPILFLRVSRPAATDIALALSGQSEVQAFHVTLARLDDLGLDMGADIVLPNPPSELRLKDEVRLVDTGSKRACYVEVDEDGQVLLREYVAACERVMGLSLGQNKRVFHVTLSNAGGGEVRASVGAVWDYPARALTVSK